jgi:lauroyl/myristoyl acyltransferase
VFAHRLGPYRFEIEIADPIFPDCAAPDRDAEMRRLLSEATAAVERRVRQTPDQWLWTHRRWKTRPEHLSDGASPAVVAKEEAAP